MVIIIAITKMRSSHSLVYNPFPFSRPPLGSLKLKEEKSLLFCWENIIFMPESRLIATRSATLVPFLYLGVRKVPDFVVPAVSQVVG